VFAADLVGTGETEGAADVFDAHLAGMDFGLAVGGADATDGVGDFEGKLGAGAEVAGDDFGLVVAAFDLVPAVEGDGDDSVGGAEESFHAVEGEEAQGEFFAEGPALLVFHVVDEFFEGIVEDAEGEDLAEGVEAFAGAVGAGGKPFGEGFGAEIAGGVLFEIGLRLFAGRAEHLRGARGSAGGAARGVAEVEDVVDDSAGEIHGETLSFEGAKRVRWRLPSTSPGEEQCTG
jgi:hypothetical protein